MFWKNRFPVEINLVHESKDGNVAIVSILFQYGNADPFLYQVPFFFWPRINFLWFYITKLNWKLTNFTFFYIFNLWNSWHNIGRLTCIYRLQTSWINWRRWHAVRRRRHESRLVLFIPSHWRSILTSIIAMSAHSPPHRALRTLSGTSWAR